MAGFFGPVGGNGTPQLGQLDPAAFPVMLLQIKHKTRMPHLPLSSSSTRDSSWRTMRKEEGTTPEEAPECTPSLRMVTCSLNLIAESGVEEEGVARLEVAAGEATQRRGNPH